MKEPIKIRLTDSPTSKKVKLRPLTSNDLKDVGLTQISDAQKKSNENNQQNNSQSIQQLDSNETN